MWVVKCPNCGVKLYSSALQEGEETTCDACGRDFFIAPGMRKSAAIEEKASTYRRSSARAV